MLRNDSRFSFVSSDSDTRSALLAIENGSPMPARSPPLLWHPVRTIERPRNDVPIVLHESVVRVGGRVFASPEDLRTMIAPDSRFDAYVDANPAVKDWSWRGMRRTADRARHALAYPTGLTCGGASGNRMPGA
jgi:hypothetical protein